MCSWNIPNISLLKNYNSVASLIHVWLFNHFTNVNLYAQLVVYAPLIGSVKSYSDSIKDQISDY